MMLWLCCFRKDAEFEEMQQAALPVGFAETQVFPESPEIVGSGYAIGETQDFEKIDFGSQRYFYKGIMIK